MLIVQLSIKIPGFWVQKFWFQVLCSFFGAWFQVKIIFCNMILVTGSKFYILVSRLFSHSKFHFSRSTLLNKFYVPCSSIPDFSFDKQIQWHYKVQTITSGWQLQLQHDHLPLQLEAISSKSHSTHINTVTGIYLENLKTLDSYSANRQLGRGTLGWTLNIGQKQGGTREILIINDDVEEEICWGENGELCSKSIGVHCKVFDG